MFINFMITKCQFQLFSLQMEIFFDHSHAIHGAEKFSQTLHTSDVFSVTDMNGMFCSAEHLNKVIGEWDLLSVKDVQFVFCLAPLHDTFNGALSFDQSIGNGMTHLSWAWKACPMKQCPWTSQLATWMWLSSSVELCHSIWKLVTGMSLITDMKHVFQKSEWSLWRGTWKLEHVFGFWHGWNVQWGIWTKPLVAGMFLPSMMWNTCLVWPSPSFRPFEVEMCCVSSPWNPCSARGFLLQSSRSTFNKKLGEWNVHNVFDVSYPTCSLTPFCF